MARLKEIKIFGLGFLVILLFLVIYFLISLESKISFEEKIVTKIIDGDTVVVEGGESVRFLGVDCDERGKECYAIAKDYAEKILLGQSVFLESDVEDKDRYGRDLRYIFIDGDNFNVKLVKEGYCVARFVSDTKYKKEIQKAEQFAIKNKVGCKWGV